MDTPVSKKNKKNVPILLFLQIKRGWIESPHPPSIKTKVKVGFGCISAEPDPGEKFPDIGITFLHRDAMRSNINSCIGS